MKKYNSLDEINNDLKRLSLERDIAWEEMKGLRYQVQEDLSAYNWLHTILLAVKKYGLLYLVKKILK